MYEFTGNTWYANPAARAWRMSTRPTDAAAFHRSLPGYAPTPLVEVPDLAAELGAGRLFVKDESSRFGLPAFKILGASYAIARALSARFDSPDEPLPLAALRDRIADNGKIQLIAATDGNHGRAVAHMARLLGTTAHIFFPASLTEKAKAGIAAERPEMTELALTYDEIVEVAADAAAIPGANGMLIQDMGWPGYELVPQWIVDGYSTLFAEADRQLAAAGVEAPAVVALPVGVGSLAQSAVQHYRSASVRPDITLLSVEPVNAPAILASLQAGQPGAVTTRQTIMAGLNCGTPSGLAWPYLAAGLDAAVLVTEVEAAAAVHDLQAAGVNAGPCGAATLAGVRVALGAHRHHLALPVDEDAALLLISTEGLEANPLPAGF